VSALLDAQPLDLIIVIGGYNSSNTCNLARICEPRLPTYHIAEPDCLLSSFEIRHKPVGAKDERISTGWLPQGRSIALGLTSGASTPDNLIGTVVRRLDALVNSAFGLSK